MDGMRKRDNNTSQDACGVCYVNPAEIQPEPWNPGVCIENCKLQFLRTVYADWTEEDGWPEGCKELQARTELHEFWQLYWCDHVFCGVAIDPALGSHLDPNVDHIINKCQNNGFFGISDPGPPSAEFACSTEARPATCTSMGTMSTSQSAPSQTATSSSTEIGVLPQPTATSPAPRPTINGLTTQGKAAIGICSLLAFLLLISLIIVFFRRRKQRKSVAGTGNRPHRTYGGGGGLGVDSKAGPTSSPTPLITPVSSGGAGVRSIIAPPLRFRDHKLALPKLFGGHGGRSSSPPLTPLTTAEEEFGSAAVRFPTSPVYSPTTSTLEPRHERVGGVAARSRAYTSSSTGRERRYQNQPRSPPPEGEYHGLGTPSNAGGSSSNVASNIWPGPGATGGDNRASSVYTAPTNSTGHSSLRNEAPVGVASLLSGTEEMGGGGSSGGGTGGSSNGLAAPLSRAPASTSPVSSPSGSLSPVRPPRPHKEMLDMHGPIGPSSPSSSTRTASRTGGTAGVWDFSDGSNTRTTTNARSTATAGRSSNTPTPPPPPPALSPPPTRILPRSRPGMAAPSSSPSQISTSTTSRTGGSGGSSTPTVWRDPVTTSSSNSPTPTQQTQVRIPATPSMPRAPPPSLASARTGATTTTTTGLTWRSPPPSTPPPPYARWDAGRESPTSLPGMGPPPQMQGRPVVAVDDSEEGKEQKTVQISSPPPAFLFDEEEEEFPGTGYGWAGSSAAHQQQEKEKQEQQVGLAFSQEVVGESGSEKKVEYGSDDRGSGGSWSATGTAMKSVTGAGGLGGVVEGHGDLGKGGAASLTTSGSSNATEKQVTVSRRDGEIGGRI